jgi:hypothetical protein
VKSDGERNRLYPVRQIKTKQRVADYGEVYTAPREVNAMLDLVKYKVFSFYVWNG